MALYKKDFARRVIIPSMQILKVVKNPESEKPQYDLAVPDDDIGIFPDYPILIQGNGLPWTLGNIYLLKRLEHARKYESRTWQNVADHLLDYLRWLESTNTNPLCFPKSPFERPTYKYQSYLLEEITKSDLGRNTAASRMSAIVNLYKGLVAYSIISNDLLELAHEEKEILIKVLGNDYTYKDLRVRSSNLAIKRQKPKRHPDRIQDGGQLRPLSRDEQSIVFEALKQSERTYRLLFAFSILTGARIQTVCTLRGSTIINAEYIESTNSYLVRVGGFNSLVDTKNDKEHTLVIPALLKQKLFEYWYSDEARQRRIMSFYGESVENYLFITKQGTPFYTSKQERKHRRAPQMHRRVGINGSSPDVKDRSGQSIREYIKNTLLPRIRRDYPDFSEFSFHDLRATFGMNLLETLLAFIDTENEKLKERGAENRLSTSGVIEDIAERMGHQI